MENRIIHTAAQGLAGRLNRCIGKEGLELQKMVMGMEILLINVSKLIAVYLLAFVMGIVVQAVILHVAYLVIKRYSFGLHSLSSTLCTVVSCCMFAVMPWLLRGAEIGNIVVFAVFALVIPCLYRYAPADTKARPLIGLKLRARLKRRAVACGVILMAVALIVPSYEVKFLLTLGAAYQCVSILPLTYKILKRSEKNYEKYEHAGRQPNGN